MSIILALETSTYACSVALINGDHITAEYTVQPQKHAKIILGLVDKVLSETGIALEQVDAVAFGQGPGSFTGLRIAASVAQGLAFGIDKPVVPVSSLAALAQRAANATGEKKILSTIDARMQEIYWGTYLVGDNGLVHNEIEDNLSAKIDIDETQYYAVGMGNEEMQYPRAQEIAQLAAVTYESQHTVLAEEAVPVYIRNNVVHK